MAISDHKYDHSSISSRAFQLRQNNGSRWSHLETVATTNCGARTLRHGDLIYLRMRIKTMLTEFGAFTSNDGVVLIHYIILLVR
jgi:hypothetical protein